MLRRSLVVVGVTAGVIGYGYGYGCGSPKPIAPAIGSPDGGDGAAGRAMDAAAATDGTGRAGADTLGSDATEAGSDAGTASVTVIDVNTTEVADRDDGLCSLLEAITASNTHASVNTSDCPAGTGHDLIRLMPGTYVVAAAVLAPTDNVEIAGAGEGEGEKVPTGAVRILVEGDNPRGCGLFVEAPERTVKLTNLTLAQQGPNSSLTGACVTAGLLQVRHVRVTGFGVGGLAVVTSGGQRAKLIAINTLVDGNYNPGDGGGIRFVGPGSQLFVEESSIVNNVSDGRGGGVFGSGSMNSSNSIKNSTVSGNVALWGGGIAAALDDEGYMALYSSTVAHNRALHTGGGIFQKAAEGTAVYTILRSDIVTNNTADDDPAQANLNADWGSNFSCTYSLLSVADLTLQPGNFGDTCRYDVADARLGPLMNMGGVDALPVHALLRGSAAIDATDALNSQERAQQRDVWDDVAGDPPIGIAPGETPAWTLFGRPLDGDGDGEALEDFGAYEFNPRWETELLAVAGSSADAHSVVILPAGASHDAATSLAARGPGAYVVYVLPVPEAGIYTVTVGSKVGPDVGRFEISMADAAGGSYSPVGGEQDGYAEVEEWRTAELGAAVVASLGQKYFRFTVTGKNQSSSGYQVVPDFIALVKQ